MGCALPFKCGTAKTFSNEMAKWWQTALVAYRILPPLAQELNTLVLVIVIFPR